MPAVLDAIVGGWQLSGVFTYQSGAPLIFTNAMVAPDKVTQTSDVGSDKYWFDTTGFAKQPAYTRRSNPWTYDGLNGPDFKNLDLTLSKRFKLVRGATLQLRLDAFNALNGMNWANPTARRHEVGLRQDERPGRRLLRPPAAVLRTHRVLGARDRRSHALGGATASRTPLLPRGLQA